MQVVDPFELASVCWPDVTFYGKQREIIYSVEHNKETYVPAGNKMGKDFVAGFIIPWFFLTRYPCRIVTTSATAEHLRVLWGETHEFIRSSKYPLDTARGGPLIVLQREIRRIRNGEEDKKSYIISVVANQDSLGAMQGHHIAITGDGIPRTLFVSDECSSVSDDYYIMACGWFDRMLAIGNPWQCNNFFKYAIKGRPGTDDKGGDIKAENNGHFHRKIIKARAEDSPNVRLGLAQIKNGEKPTNEIIVPGVKSYEEYVLNRKMWTKEHQCVALDAEFYEGPDEMMFPPEWLNLAEQKAAKLVGVGRKAKAIGIDPAEGGDQTTMAAVDEQGLIDLVSKKTPDTSVITSEAIAFMRKHGVKPEDVLFDAGGGGKQHVDRLREQGYKVRAIAFGGGATPDKRVGVALLETRKEEDEVRYIYKNRRAEMYFLLRLRLDPSMGEGFAIPAEYTELRHELRAIRLMYGKEGQIELPPKNKPSKDSTVETLIDLIGHSPDNADALVLAVFGLEERGHRFVVQSMT